MGLYQYACEKEGILWAAMPPTPLPVITDRVCCVCQVGDGEGGEERDVCWLAMVPATRKCISGTDLIRQFYMLPH